MKVSDLQDGLQRAWTRLVSRPVTIVGHSHLWALAEAIGESKEDIRLIDFWKHADPFSSNELALIDQIIPAPLEGPVVSLIGGSRYNILTLYRHPRAFDFISPDDPQPPEVGAEIIPFEAVRESLLAWMAPNQALLTAVRSRTRGRMYHLEAPAPWGEDRNPADHKKDPWLQPTDSFGSRGLRRKMARLESRMMKAFCSANDIIFLNAPPGSATDEGYLKPEFFGDLLHANAAYGRLALAHVLAAVKK